MHCPKCGTENPEQAKFCKGCGYQFSDTDDGQPRRILWLFGLVLAALVIGGGLFLGGLIPSPFVKPGSATVTTTSTPLTLQETGTAAPNSAQRETLTPTSPLTRHSTSEPTSTPTPNPTPTPTPFKPTSTPTASQTPDPLVQCGDAPQQGLQIGDQVQVCTQVDSLMLRDAPLRGGDEISRMEPGTALAIVDGPICADGWLWWQVQAEGGEIGWVAEGGDETDPYYICKTPACEPVTGPFAEVWAVRQQTIGCKTSESFTGLVAEEHFEGGIMFWREAFDDERAPVLFDDGTWRYYEHTRFVEGSPEFSCVDDNTPAQCPPTPKRGFGMMWCDIPELRNRLGNALDCERGYYATMQTFTDGFMLRNDRGLLYILFDDGTWQVMR